MIELRHLRYAVAVADEGHITRAAQRLGIQQPPLSQQIRSLESMVGATLFRRMPRGVEVTEAGRTFVEKARAILRDVELAVEATRNNARGDEGILAVGFTSSAAFHPLVTSAVRTFGENWPGVSLKLEELSTPDLIAAIRARQLDIAFIRSPVEDSSGLTIAHILDEEMLVALPDSHRLASRDRERETIHLSELSGEDFILYRRPSGPGLYDTVIAACLSAGFSPRIKHEAPRLLSTLSLVAAGLGISLVPRSMARLETHGIAYLQIALDTPLVAPLNLATRSAEFSGALKRFVETVRQGYGG